MRHRRPDLARAQHVPLDAERGPLKVAGVGDAVVARVRRGPSLAVDERDLSHLAQLVLGEQLVERDTRHLAVPHQRETGRPVAPLGERLRGDGPGAGERPRARGARVERTRLDGDAELAAFGVPGDDRVRHVDDPTASGRPSFARAIRVEASATTSRSGRFTNRSATGSSPSPHRSPRPGAGFEQRVRRPSSPACLLPLHSSRAGRRHTRHAAVRAPRRAVSRPVGRLTYGKP
jgi:hypothetical protein